MNTRLTLPIKYSELIRAAIKDIQKCSRDAVRQGESVGVSSRYTQPVVEESKYRYKLLNDPVQRYPTRKQFGYLRGIAKNLEKVGL